MKPGMLLVCIQGGGAAIEMQQEEARAPFVDSWREALALWGASRYATGGSFF